MALLAGLVLLLNCPESRAGIIGADSGNTTTTNQHVPASQAVDGTINFAVYQNSGGGGSDVFGTGFANLDNFGVTSHNSKTTGGGPSASKPFDTTAKYLYVYEVANNGTGNSVYRAILPVSAGSITSFGVFQNHGSSTGQPIGFTDNAGKVSGQQLQSKGANNFGPETFGGSPSQLVGFTQNAPGNLIGSNVGLFHPGLALNPAATGAISLDLQAGQLIATFSTSSTGFGLPATGTSQLFYFTSNVAPSFHFAELFNQKIPPGAFGLAPSVVPVPPSIVLCVVGLVVVGAVHGVRRWRAGASPA
jgi:hypothetical protein